jgi:hypothetical protein
LLPFDVCNFRMFLICSHQLRNPATDMHAPPKASQKRNAIVYATGSTPPQNRLYKSCISKYVDEVKKGLAVFTLEAFDHVKAGGAAIHGVTLKVKYEFHLLAGQAIQSKMSEINTTILYS